MVRFKDRNTLGVPRRASRRRFGESLALTKEQVWRRGVEREHFVIARDHAVCAYRVREWRRFGAVQISCDASLWPAIQGGNCRPIGRHAPIADFTCRLPATWRVPSAARPSARLALSSH